MHPSYLGFQVDWPVFVKIPFTADGRHYGKGEHFNWLTMYSVDVQKVATLYAAGYVYHNSDLEVQTKVGDRLSEMDNSQLDLLVTRLNSLVQAKVNSVTEFEKKRCKKSKIADKQRGLLRSFLRQNMWIEDKFFEVRDSILAPIPAKQE